jgi:hypothetical protein
VVFFENPAWSTLAFATRTEDRPDPPHPDQPALASTHPHHKHVPPEIKHHRIAAPGLRFDVPNLPLLIEEVERQLLVATTATDAD